jgi:L1 cell adhesion molecule like protein
MLRITRDGFEDLCVDLYREIEKIIHSLINNYGEGITINNIDEVILVGGATKMTAVKTFLGKIFTPKKIKSNLNPDEAVAFGATLDRAKMEENDKINFNLQDIVAYNLGVENERNELTVIVKKYAKIPCSKDKDFKVNLTKEKPNILVNIYEGNNKLVKDNKLLAEIMLDNINTIGEVIYNVKFNVDVNSKLTVNIKIESLGLEREEEIKNNITHALADKTSKKIKY